MEVVTASVAVVLSVIGGLVAAFAALRQRKTDEIKIIVEAQQRHMELLTSENEDLRARMLADRKAFEDEKHDLRERLRSAEDRIGDLRVQVANCDSDKNRLRMEVDELKRTVGRTDLGQRTGEGEKN